MVLLTSFFFCDRQQYTQNGLLKQQIIS